MRFLPATDCKATFHTCCESYSPRRVMFTFESSDPGHSTDAHRPRRVMLSLPWSGKRLSLSPLTRCHYCWLLFLRCSALPSVCGHCTVSVTCLYPCVYPTLAQAAASLARFCQTGQIDKTEKLKSPKLLASVSQAL